MFGEGGYDHESRCIMGGGFVVIFAYGFTPTIWDLAHVKVEVKTTAFTATVATRKNRTQCQSCEGNAAGFLEKTLNDWWGKYVIIVNSTSPL